MESVGASALDAHLGYWLRLVSNAVSGSFADALAGHGVGVAEWVVLRALFDGPRAPSELAETLGITRGAITKVADKLIEKGLADRESAVDDRRYQMLSLTRTGKALTPKLARLADDNDVRFFAPLKAAERATLERLMRALAHHHRMQSTPIK